MHHPSGGSSPGRAVSSHETCCAIAAHPGFAPIVRGATHEAMADRTSTGDDARRGRRRPRLPADVRQRRRDIRRDRSGCHVDETRRSAFLPGAPAGFLPIRTAAALSRHLCARRRLAGSAHRGLRGADGANSGHAGSDRDRNPERQLGTPATRLHAARHATGSGSEGQRARRGRPFPGLPAFGTRSRRWATLSHDGCQDPGGLLARRLVRALRLERRSELVPRLYRQQSGAMARRRPDGVPSR